MASTQRSQVLQNTTLLFLSTIIFKLTFAVRDAVPESAQLVVGHHIEQYQLTSTGINIETRSGERVSTVYSGCRGTTTTL